MADYKNSIIGNFKNPLILASRKRRIAAFILDHFILTFLIVLLIFVFLGASYLDTISAEKTISTILFGLIVGFGIYFLKDIFKGISPGKWIMGIMVRDDQNRNIIPSFGRLFLRNIFLLIWPIEFIVLAVSDHKKRIGDIVARTLVLKNPNKPLKRPRILTLIGIGVLFFIFVFAVSGNAMKNSEAYKLAIHEIEKNVEIKKETGGIVGYGFMPTGSINISETEGEAQLKITVKGKVKDIDVNTYLERRNGHWALIELTK
jgi:uncharacterized RDD family membrane protein YckC